ncbi:MAG: ribonuclease III [Patescibacteria group bacterium]|nr:ribonuclease III [Patescibacteria group bacterium]
MNLDKLEQKLNIKFKNKNLLKQAFVHRSYLNENKEKRLESNERLEFLGDSILGFVISSFIYDKLPRYKEGKLTNLRSNLVRTEALAKLSEKLNLGENLLLSKGELAGNGKTNISLLADLFEAIIGAIYVDQGLEAAEKFIINQFESIILETARRELKDSKSLLQEKIQVKIKETPIYKILESDGPDHDKTFLVGVYSQGKLLAKALGSSKQSAEEKAARFALEKIS